VASLGFGAKGGTNRDAETETRNAAMRQLGEEREGYPVIVRRKD